LESGRLEPDSETVPESNMDGVFVFSFLKSKKHQESERRRKKKRRTLIGE